MTQHSLKQSHQCNGNRLVTVENFAFVESFLLFLRGVGRPRRDAGDSNRCILFPAGSAAWNVGAELPYSAHRASARMGSEEKFSLVGRN